MGSAPRNVVDVKRPALHNSSLVFLKKKGERRVPAHSRANLRRRQENAHRSLEQSERRVFCFQCLKWRETEKKDDKEATLKRRAMLAFIALLRIASSLKGRES